MATEIRTQPIDRNPNLTCQCCGDSHGWQDYWEGRHVVLGDHRTSKMYCDDCLARFDRWHDRLTKNHRLTEYTNKECYTEE